MPPTSQLIPPGTPSPQPTEEMHPLDKLILQILQQAQTAPIQPPPVEQFGTGRKIALALASLDPTYRKERIDPLIQQRQAAAQFNPELERLKLLHGIIGPLGPVLSSMQRSETKPAPANKVTTENIGGRLIEFTRNPAGVELSRRDLGQAGTPPPPDTVIVAYGPDGKAYFAPKPHTLKSPEPIPLPGGGQAEKPIPPGTDVQIQTSINSLNIAKQTIADMRKNYEQGVAEQDTPTRLGSSAAASIPGIRTMAGYLGPRGRIHDAKRRLLVLELQKSISGGNRVLEAILRGITEAVPSYAENPEVARPLYDSLEQMADAGLQTYLSVRHNPGAADVAASATPSPVSPPKRIRRSNFNQLPDSEKQRALRDGVKVID